MKVGARYVSNKSNRLTIQFIKRPLRMR